MEDIKTFLRWYLGPRTKITRGWFNVVLFVAFVPVLLVKMDNFTQTARQQAQQYAPLVGVLESAVQNQKQLNIDDVESYLEDTQNVRTSVRSALKDITKDITHPMPLRNVEGFDWGELLNFVIYVLLVPIVQMRLRDLGYWENKMWAFTGMIYSGIVVDNAQSLLNIDMGFAIPLLAGLLTFVGMAWLCVAESKKHGSDKPF